MEHERTVHRHPATDDLELARSHDANPGDLARLARSPYPFVIDDLAANPSTPPDTLRDLLPTAAVRDHDRDVLRSLAGNPSTPPDVLGPVAALLMATLDRSALNREWHAVIAMFGRADVPVPVLLGLLDDLRATRHFREEAAKVAVDPEVLDRLRHDRSGRVRAAATPD